MHHCGGIYTVRIKKTMTKQEIANHIKENEPWTADKEKSLICDLGGGKIKHGHFYVSYGFKVAESKIREGLKILEQNENSMTYEQFIEQNQEML